MGCEVSRDLGDEVPLQGAAGRDSSTNAGPIAADMSGQRSGDRAGSSEPGSCAHVGECAAATSTGQAGAVHERQVEPDAARRISPVEEAVLGTTSVGTGVFLCERRRGGRRDDPALYREPKMGGPG